MKIYRTTLEALQSITDVIKLSGVWFPSFAILFQYPFGKPKFVLCALGKKFEIFVQKLLHGNCYYQIEVKASFRSNIFHFINIFLIFNSHLGNIINGTLNN